MSDRDELQALRRLAELEAKASGAPSRAPSRAPAKLEAWELEAMDPTSGMSGLDKFRANLGAGMADLWQGVKQRATEFGGDEEAIKRAKEDVAEKRARDEKLAASQWGGKYTQMAGAAIPVIAASTLLPGSGSVLGSTLSGAGSGAATGYIQPTVEGESVGSNVAWGAGLGAALPLVFSGIKKGVGAVRGASQRRAAEKVVSALGNGDEAAGREAAEAIIRGAETPAAGGAARTAAEEALGDASTRGIGEITPGRAARLQSQAGNTGDIPISVAARLQNEELARLEQASRLRNPELWRGFDESHATALANRLQSATSEADEVASRIAERGNAYRAARQAAVEAVDPEAFRLATTGMREGVESAMNLPAAVNPDVRSALTEARRVLEMPNINAEHLMELRKELTAGIKPGNVLRSADRSNPAILETVRAIDLTLDALSGGRWSPVNEGFSQASRGVEAGRAAQRVRDVFYNPATGLANKTAQTAAGDVPMITEAGLNTAQKAGWDAARRVSQFSPQTQAGLDEIANAVRAQNIIQRLQRTATAGGGSGTGSNLTALAQEEARQALTEGLIRRAGTTGKVVSGVINAGDALINSRADAIVARALQDEAATQTLLRQLQSPVIEPELKRSIAQRLAAAMRETPGNLGRASLSAVPATAGTNE